MKARMRTALILKFHQLPQRMCLVTMRLMVLDYKDPITRFYMEWRKDPSCTTIYGFYTQDFTVSIFLIYRRFWIDKLQGSATATLHYVIVKFLLGHEFPNSFLLFRMHKRAQLRIPICSPPPTVNACGLWALNAKFVIPTRQCLTRLDPHFSHRPAETIWFLAVRSKGEPFRRFLED